MRQRVGFTVLGGWLLVVLGGWILAAVLFATPPAQAAEAAETPVDATTRDTVIRQLVVEMNGRYIFPAKVAALRDKLADRARGGAYDGLGGTAFAKALQADAYTVLHDKHVRMQFKAAGYEERADAAAPTPAEIRAFEEQEATSNYGIERVQRLDGNVGYMEIRGFASADGAAPVLASAMQFLSHTKALIIDLRRSHGGDPETVSLVCSYLLPPDQRVEVNDLVERDGQQETTQQFWTSRVPGPYYLDKPVYVLTSSETVSAAEELPYDLQNLKRATIVGETTAGGANPGGLVRLTRNFRAFIPVARALSPITHTNWEGVGIKPDLPTAAPDALKSAYRSAVAEELKAATDPDVKAILSQLLTNIDQQTADRILSS